MYLDKITHEISNGTRAFGWYWSGMLLGATFLAFLLLIKRDVKHKVEKRMARLAG